MRARDAIGAGLLVLQVLWFAYAQTTSARYFCWAPLHEHVFYRISAERAGVFLSDRQIMQRYGRRGAFYDGARKEFWELNAAEHIVDSIAWREATLPPAQRMRVSMSYRIDDREPRTWTSTR